MAVRDILKMGDPRLLRVAQTVPTTDFDSDALHLLVSDLLDTMKAANGVMTGLINTVGGTMGRSG